MGQASQVGPLVNRLRDALNYYGQTTTMDGQGRILIHPLLREKAEIDGEEVTVLGQHDRLVVWNRRTFEERLEKNPLTEIDLHGLEALGF
jgi:DNA-binding transcriptional regulator/RsmH inhibitor MraZ